MGRIKMAWPSGTQDAVKERHRAIVWATDRVGGWESSNVLAEVVEWLAKDGYELPLEHVAKALHQLDDKGWAIRVVQGKRTVGFVLNPDLVVDTPAYVKARMVRDAPAPAEPAPRKPRPPKGAGKRRLPPLPGDTRAADRPPWLHQLCEGLTEYWREDPAGADAWAMMALDMLTPDGRR
jgi:hypothetical protein